jgi:hypothetical protein
LLKAVRDGRAVVPVAIRPIVEKVMADRPLLRNIEYLRFLEAEEQRFWQAPAGLKRSPLQGEILGAVSIAKSIALHNAATRVRRIYERWLEELDRQLLASQSLLIDVERAKRDERQRAPAARARPERVYGVVEPDHEHVRWPFDGEYWKDELGSYRQVVISRCGG